MKSKMAISAKRSHYHSCKVIYQVLGACLMRPRAGRHLSHRLTSLSQLLRLSRAASGSTQNISEKSA